MKIKRKNIISIIIILVVVILVTFTIVSNIVYNKNLPKVTTVQAFLDIYSVSKEYDGEFSYTKLEGYTLPYDVCIDEILVREGSNVKAGDQLLKVTIDTNAIDIVNGQIEDNNNQLAVLTQKYQLAKSSYSPNLYQANLEAEIARLQEQNLELLYDQNGAIDQQISIIESEILVLQNENKALLSNATNNDDLTKKRMEAEMQNLLNSISKAQTEEEQIRINQQYEIAKMEYDIFVQSLSEDKVQLEIKNNTTEIHKKNKAKELLEIKKASTSTIPEQLIAKQNELDNFIRTKVNSTTIQLEEQQNAIESLEESTERLENSIEPLRMIAESGGFIVADEDFVVHKITAGIDRIHKANDSIFIRTTPESKPCFKWNTEKDKFQDNFELDSMVNVSYYTDETNRTQSVGIASKMQLDEATEYISCIENVEPNIDRVKITMTYTRNEYVTYLPVTAIHKNAYGENVVYIVNQRDSIFKRETYVEEVPVLVLYEGEQKSIVQIYGDVSNSMGCVSNLSVPLKTGDVVKVIQEYNE